MGEITVIVIGSWHFNANCCLFRRIDIVISGHSLEIIGLKKIYYIRRNITFHFMSVKYFQIAFI